MATASYGQPEDGSSAPSFGNPITDWDDQPDYDVVKTGGYFYQAQIILPETGERVTKVYNSKTPWSDEDNTKLSISLSNIRVSSSAVGVANPSSPPNDGQQQPSNPVEDAITNVEYNY